MKIIQVINVQEPAARKNRFLDIEHVVQRQSSALCTCLPGLNVSTGCYSEGAFFGKGKLCALRLTKRHVKFRELF